MGHERPFHNRYSKFLKGRFAASSSPSVVTDKSRWLAKIAFIAYTYKKPAPVIRPAGTLLPFPGQAIPDQSEENWLMKPLKLFTILGITFLLSLSTLTFAKGKPPKDDPPTGTTAEYSAELTAGDFVFAGNGSLEKLTANNKGTSITGDFALVMSPESANAWDYLFENCSELLAESGVIGFSVPAGNWWINYTRSRKSPDKIHITMRDLEIYPGTSPDYSGVRFDLDLHGEIESDKSFLPKSINSIVSHDLTKFKLWAGASGQNGLTCNSAGGGWDGWADLAAPSTLVIKRTQ